MKYRTIIEFMILITLSGLLSYLISDILITDDLLYDELSKRLSHERVEELLNLRHERDWFSYIFLPIKYSLKFFLLSACIFTGAFFLDIKVTFKAIYKALIRAEFIMLIPVLAKILWFLLIDTNYNLEDMRNFAPLSAYSLIPSGDYEIWTSYLLKSLNLFELLYILVLASETRSSSDINNLVSIKLVLISYGSAWLLWVTFALFLIISFS